MHSRTSCFYGAGRAEKANADDTFEKYLINADGERVNPACAIYGSNATGKASDAQIICATHDVEMLDLGLFRRDQIWFTDINPDYHRTTLKPLSGYPCRKDENVQRKHLESKYCKVARDAWAE